MTGWLGYAVLFAIVFAETGLLIGFFLPGDSLLFTVGVVAGAGELNIFLINAILIVAAIVGDATGYLLGRQAGPRRVRSAGLPFFQARASRPHAGVLRKAWRKDDHLCAIRPHRPNFRALCCRCSWNALLAIRRLFNIFGGMGWVILMTTAGYYLGGFPIIQRHFEKVVIAIVLISVLPVAFEVLKSRRARPLLRTDSFKAAIATGSRSSSTSSPFATPTTG